MWQTIQAAIRHEVKRNGPILLEVESMDEGYGGKNGSHKNLTSETLTSRYSGPPKGSEGQVNFRPCLLSKEVGRKRNAKETGQ
jgi:hypothetical protein